MPPCIVGTGAPSDWIGTVIQDSAGGLLGNHSHLPHLEQSQARPEGREVRQHSGSTGHRELQRSTGQPGRWDREAQHLRGRMEHHPRGEGGRAGLHHGIPSIRYPWFGSTGCHLVLGAIMIFKYLSKNKTAAVIATGAAGTEDYVSARPTSDKLKSHSISLWEAGAGNWRLLDRLQRILQLKYLWARWILGAVSDVSVDGSSHSAVRSGHA